MTFRIAISRVDGDLMEVYVDGYGRRSTLLLLASSRVEFKIASSRDYCGRLVDNILYGAGGAMYSASVAA